MNRFAELDGMEFFCLLLSVNRLHFLANTLAIPPLGSLVWLNIILSCPFQAQRKVNVNILNLPNLNVSYQCNLQFSLIQHFDARLIFLPEYLSCKKSNMYSQISNISGTFPDNKLVDQSDVVGASPVGAAPTTSSFAT